MSLRGSAGALANIADKLTYVSRQRTVDGQEVIIVPREEAEQMKESLLTISHQINDIQDDLDKDN